jgi:hypothetical protein
LLKERQAAGTQAALNGTIEKILVIPFPERIPLFYAATFATFLCVLMAMSGTGMLFTAMAFIFIIVATLAFNVAGGFARTQGSYIFFFATLAVIVGMVVKVVVWEPVDSLLRSPLTTMGAYTGGIIGMLASAYITRRIASNEGILQDICSLDDMGSAAIGCVVAGFGIPFLTGFLASTGSPLFLPIASAASQLNRFMSMGIILGTTYEIRVSGGKRSINGSVLLGVALIWFTGVLIGFSKEALFAPLLCWLVSCAALRYRFARYQIIGMVCFLVFSISYLVPFCQIGRNANEENATLGARISVAYGLLSDIGEVRDKYKAEQASERRDENTYFFEKDEGFFERLVMFSIDDRLITVTREKGPFGMSPLVLYAGNVIPRVLWKNKPTLAMGNLFAHEIGFNEEDTTTGISFSPVAEAYHEAEWFGVLVVAPIIWVALFTALDSLCGDLRKSPWGILVFAMYAHIAPEGMLAGAFYMMTYGALIVVVVAFFSADLMPMVSSFVAPPKRKVFPVRSAIARHGSALDSRGPHV